MPQKQKLTDRDVLRLTLKGLVWMWNQPEYGPDMWVRCENMIRRIQRQLRKAKKVPKHPIKEKICQR